jgi:hypothetical protein
MWSGVLSFLALSPGQSLVWSDREIVYTFYKGQQQIPGPPLVMLLSPLLRVPGAWLWGPLAEGSDVSTRTGGVQPAPDVWLKRDTTPHTSAAAHAAKSSCSDGGLRM